MNIQAKVAIHKKKHPELYCPAANCLWKVKKLDHDTQTYFPRNECPSGYCPRHQNIRTNITKGPRLAMIEAIERFLA
jgi:hypothetical protein